ncbi:histone-lysine N-methyltransferase PRDM9-like isoform X1 [Colias croceus]|uniref:histone-lysine N-methyltransferase PRDM9-like isoform X1 n=1 Tax=Colias crocea TaxID=72248 RepID=UPI001E27A3CC|nr:histone-lysine N-methyltransferase PRDM9-like isoform X1 [Colias croceus]
MSSYLCFICHSTVNDETNEETREKYKEVVGINLCPDSHLCYICCHVLNKLFMFRSICLKRSLEYPVLFSEKGTINLHRSDIEINILCPEDCDQYQEKQYQYEYNNDFNENNFNDNHYININNEYEYNDKQYEVNKTENIPDHYNFNHDNDTLNNDEKLHTNVNIINKYTYEQFEHVNNINDSKNDEIHDMDGTKCENNEMINVNEINNDTVRAEVNNDVPELYEDESEDRLIINTDDDKSVNDNDTIDLNYQNDDKQDDQSPIINEVNATNTEENLNEINIEDGIPKLDIEITVKKKKTKKKGFKKVVRTLEEQKAELERNRKSRKYIEAEFKCYNCALGFLFKDTYQAHMMRHEESNGEYRCDTCTLRFSTHALLRTHIASHTDVYRCQICGDTMGPRAKRTHGCGQTRPVESVACPQCGNLFRDANGLQQHIRRVHTKTSNRLHSCTVCNENFTNQSVLRTHMIKHIKRKFQCDQCPRIYSSPYTLKQHKKTHEINTERYYCSHCDVVFNSRKSLLAHKRNTVAHQNTVLECPLCARVCASRPALLAHARTHARAHVCAQCGRAYSARRTLVRHMKTHTGEVVVRTAVCHLCGNSFKGTNKLNRHLRENCEKAKLEEQLASLYE